jgi:hypothetical protein
MTANINSQPILLANYQGASLQAVWTGTPTGTLKLQCCNDIPAVTDTTDPSTWNWTDVANSSQSLTGSAGNFVWNVFDVYYRWLRVAYVFSSGTGTLQVAVCAKEFGN